MGGIKPMIRLVGLFLASLALVATAACNMVRGAGDDLKSAADAVDEET